MRHYGNRLIWDRRSPAPFESAWSVFVKLLLLNSMRANHIASLISKPVEDHYNNYSLDFRHSNWLNFERFSEALQIEVSRLRVGFLDQLGITLYSNKYEISPGIKVCKECLAKGYHCVFFEVGFIDHCPWHQIKLETCWTCEDFVIGKEKPKLRVSKNLHDAKINNTFLDTYDSGCGHIHFSDSVAFRPIQLTLLEKTKIKNCCMQFLQWAREVCKSPGLSENIFRYAFPDTESALPKMHMSAAEKIAGPCPWPVAIISKNIRSHIWRDNSPPQSQFNVCENQRGSDEDLSYRSIRRHLFRKYVLAHQPCWKEIKNYSHQESLRICSESACPVALAYAIWRLRIEKFFNVEVFNFGRLGHLPITKYDSYLSGIPDSLKAQSSFMYAQFFYIWEGVLALMINQDPTIEKVWTWEFYDVATIPVMEKQSDEWTVIFPDYRTLENQSLAQCCGVARPRGWMLNPAWKHHLDDYFVACGIKDRFQVRVPIGKAESIYQYLNLPGISL